MGAAEQVDTKVKAAGKAAKKKKDGDEGVAVSSTRATYDPHVYQNPHPDDALGKGKTKGKAKAKAGDANTHVCSYAACGKPGATKQCSQCKRAWYCSATCQKHDWQRHKRGCRASVAAAARAATRAREETATREAAAPFAIAAGSGMAPIGGER